MGQFLFLLTEWCRINVCTFAQAAFVPASEGALDTSYFTSRFSWNPSDEHVYAASEYEDSSDNGSVSGSSSCLDNRQDEMVWLYPQNELNIKLNRLRVNS